MNFEEFNEQANRFLAELENRMSEKGISLPIHWSIDHLCFRVATVHAYEDKKMEFTQFAKLLIESEVNGRPISTFKLLHPILFWNRKIDLVELPAPKSGKITSEGFEHVEVVCDQPFSEIKNKYKGIEFGESGLGKDFNAELEINLGGMAIKFHHLSLESVVTLEQNSKVFSALKKSDVLSQCRPFSPLVVGTFPLGIQTAGSDLDILLYHHDIAEALLRLETLYGSYQSFECYNSTYENSGKSYGNARFYFDGIPFELYIENTETLRQRAYLHFHIEERLLKIGGANLREKVIEFRKQGMKTEPAFGAVLGIKNDPYLELIEMQIWSDDQLEKAVKSTIR